MYNAQDSIVVYDFSVSGTSTTISDLQSDTEYYISVAAVNTTGVSSYRTISGKTRACKLNTYAGTYIHVIFVLFRVVDVMALSKTIELTWPDTNSISQDIDVTWKRSNSSQCPYEDDPISTVLIHQQSAIVFGLDEYTAYNIIVRITVRNVTDDVMAVTREAGNTNV